MPTDERCGTPPGILAAIDFPHALVKTVLSGYLVTDEDARKLGGEAWKLFSIKHIEGEKVKSAVYRASRIEGALSTGPHDTIMLTLSFLGKGKRAPFFTAWVSFQKVHGTAHVLGTSSRC